MASTEGLGLCGDGRIACFGEIEIFSFKILFWVKIQLNFSMNVNFPRLYYPQASHILLVTSLSVFPWMKPEKHFKYHVLKGFPKTLFFIFKKKIYVKQLQREQIAWVSVFLKAIQRHVVSSITSPRASATRVKSLIISKYPRTDSSAS